MINEKFDQSTSDNSTETITDNTNNNNKSEQNNQLININIINEDSNIKQVSASLLSIQSTLTSKKFKNSNLSLNKKLTTSNPASTLLNSIKNSTLNVLTKPLHSRTPSPKLSKKNKNQQPIDLEANIIVNNDNLNINEESSDEESSEENKNKTIISSVLTKRLVKRKNNENIGQLNEEDDNNDDEEEDEDDDDDDEDYEDIDFEKNTQSSSTNNKTAKTSKLNTLSVPRPSLKTLSNCTSTNTNSASQLNLSKLSAMVSSKESKKTVKGAQQPVSLQLNDLTNQNDSPKQLKPILMTQTSLTENKQKQQANSNQSNTNQTNINTTPTILENNSNRSNVSITQAGANLPLKTILTNSTSRNMLNNLENNLNTSNTLNTSSNSNTNNNINVNNNSNRQSVSFSQDTLFNNNNNNNNNNNTYNNSSNNEINRSNSLKYQRSISENVQKENLNYSSTDFSDKQQQQQQQVTTRLLSNTNQSDSTNEVDQSSSNKIRKSITVCDEFNNNNNNNLNQKSKLELALNSSFASSTTGLNSSYSPSLMNRQYSQTQQLPVKVLHKTMTKGSKAMRIMGSNNTNMLPNGLKNSPSSGAVSLTSNSSRSASNKKQQQKRLFFKNGNINISRCNIDKRRRRYLTDIFTTLIDLKWRYNILVFALGFFVSWTLFAITWYLISYFHGDLESTDKNRTACISGIHGFAGAILFSIETQQTIGYGVRFTTEKCPEAILVMMIQSSVGVMIQSFMVGVVFAKLSRPKKRSETLMFSKNAVISLRDGRLCLICRVGDMRKSHIVEAHVRMYLIKKKVTLEGEIMPLHMYDLNVGWDKGLDRLFLVWPLTIEHNIDENSPFWTISAEDLKKERFELAVILEGIVESTGMTTQARSSYLVNEILWGHRFEKLITFQKEDGTYKIDYSRFDMTVPIDTPTCSAKELAELREQEKYYNLLNLNDSTPSTINSSYITNGNGDLRKRRVDNKQDEENYEQNLNTNNTTTNNNNMINNNSSTNIRMVIEDHSNENKNKTDTNYFFNEDSNYEYLINSTPNTTTTSVETNQNLNANELNMIQFIDNNLSPNTNTKRDC